MLSRHRTAREVERGQRGRQGMDKNRLFGGNPLGVLVRLVVLSIIVGVVMSALNIRP